MIDDEAFIKKHGIDEYNKCYNYLKKLYLIYGKTKFERTQVYQKNHPDKLVEFGYSKYYYDLDETLLTFGLYQIQDKFIELMEEYESGNNRYQNI